MANKGKHFADVLMHSIHVIGDSIDDAIELSDVTDALYTGWDLGAAVKHAAVIMEKRLITSEDGEKEWPVFCVIDEMFHKSEQLSISHLGLEMLDKMTAIETEYSRKFHWTHYSDDSATSLYRASSGSFDYLEILNATDNAIPAVHGVKALLSASDGTLWVATKAGLGFIEGSAFRLFWPSNGVPRLEMRALAEDQAGQIWAGGGDGVLYRARKFKGQALIPPEARSAHPIWSLLADADGTIWAGTFRGGLLRYADGKFTRITTQEGLRDDVICQLLDDGRGNLWMGSQQGIFRVPKAELHALAAGTQRSVTCTAYGRYDGLPRRAA